MALHRIEKGLDLPIEGAPLQVVRDERLPLRVAVMADDFPGLKPGMAVAEGERDALAKKLYEEFSYRD